MKHLPKPATGWALHSQTSSDSVALTLSPPAGRRPLDFFPLAESGLDLAPPSWKAGGKAGERSYQWQHDRSEFSDAPVRALVLYEDSKSTIASVMLTATEERNSGNTVATILSLWTALLYAFLGGLLLNAMPCVFPVLGLKLLSIIGQKEKPAGIRWRQSGLYSLGVVGSTLGLASLMLFLRASGEGLGWGFQLQNPVIVYALAMVFSLMGFSFLGFFEFRLQLPQRWLKSGEGSDDASQFFSGLLTVAIATPCTAPFMGVALGATLTMPAVEVLCIFASLGFGIASPYILVAVWPGVLGWLPRPGAWMQTTQQAMAFPLFATAAWLLWILSSLAPESGQVIGLSGLLTISFGTWIANKTRRTSWIAISLATCASIAPVLVERSDPASLITWQTFSELKMKKLHDQGRHVFVDFTADWCVTCKVNERLTFPDDAVQAYIQKNEIVMLKADWTKKDPEIAAVLQYYGRIGVPLYLFWPADQQKPQIFPEVLTAGSFLKEMKAAMSHLHH